MIRIQITTKLNDYYDITCEQIELENTCPQFLKIITEYIKNKQ
jgi:hypothetical protein